MIYIRSYFNIEIALIFLYFIIEIEFQWGNIDEREIKFICS